MPEVINQDEHKFEIIIDEDYIKSFLEEAEEEDEGNEEIEFTPEQWDDLLYKLNDRFFPVIQETINEILEESELEKRNEGAEKSVPRYLVKYRHPNAFVHEWQEIAFLKTEEDAKSYITYHHGHGVDEEWKIEKCF